MPASTDFSQLNHDQLRRLAEQMQGQLQSKDTLLAEQEAELARCAAAIKHYQIGEEQLTHEMALLKRHRFGKRAEGLSRVQYSLLEDLVDEDIAGIEREIEQLTEAPQTVDAKPRTPKRRPLPPQLPRTEIRHEPESTTCRCGCQLSRIG